jgi:hypothetical protein
MRICRLNSPEICLSKRSHNEQCYKLALCFLERSSVTFLFLIMLSVCVSGAFGQSNSSFYVSTIGDDSNPGTQRAPWRTIQHAADTVRAGSTVNVRGGIYEERVSIKTSGNATDGYITFRSYHGETAVLDAEHFTPDGRSAILTIHNKSYVRIEGLEIRNYRTPNISSLRWASVLWVLAPI